MTRRQQLNGFLAEFTTETAARARAALTRMRKLTPGAIEMVYDNYNCASPRSVDTELKGIAVVRPERGASFIH